MLFWGAIASAAAGILGGGGGGGIIGDILGGVFGGGSGGGIGGWLGGLFENLLGGLFGNRREEAANQTVNQEFARQPTQERATPERTTRQPAAPEGEEETTIAAPQEESSEECGCCCCDGSSPSPSEEAPSESPSGGLEVEGDVITTEGGYEIEMMGPTEWKVTGPDGSTTRIWGDPHVDEGDRNATSESNGGWDFKDNTTFVLGDGTEIHVTTVPRDNGTTVTGQLNIVNGDHAVEVTGVDKGKGQIGEVTTNGAEVSHEYSGYQDVYQGEQADDWTYNGREIVGSTGKGEEFVLDDEMEPGTEAPETPEVPEVPAVGGGTDDGTGDGLDASLFEPMSLAFNIGDYSISFEIEENDQAQA